MSITKQQLIAALTMLAQYDRDAYRRVRAAAWEMAYEEKRLRIANGSGHVNDN